MQRSILLLLLVLTACGGGNVATTSPQSGRVLGLAVNEIPTKTYGSTYAEAMTLGVREVSVSLDWALLEPTVGSYDDTLPGIINSFYPTQPADLTLVLRPLDTPGPRLPSDLAGRTFDDPLVIAAFENFLTHLHGQLTTLNASGKLRWVHVGNEINAHLGSDSGRWSSWTTFFNAAKTRIELLWGSATEVSTVVEFGVLNQPTIRPLYLNLLPMLDVAALTYYPLNSDFTFKPPSVVAGDFATMVSTIPTTPIVLQEAGYASSVSNNSSEAIQAGFVTAVFAAWDTHTDRIPLIDFTWQYDISTAAANQHVIDFGLQGSANEATFRSYLETLGLSRHDGTEKLALQRLRDELAARNWVP